MWNTTLDHPHKPDSCGISTLNGQLNTTALSLHANLDGRPQGKHAFVVPTVSRWATLRDCIVMGKTVGNLWKSGKKTLVPGPRIKHFRGKLRREDGL